MRQIWLQYIIIMEAWLASFLMIPISLVYSFCRMNTSIRNVQVSNIHQCMHWTILLLNILCPVHTYCLTVLEVFCSDIDHNDHYCPACSPDLYSIEQLLDQLGRAVRNRVTKPTTLQDLRQIVVDEWNATSGSYPAWGGDARLLLLVRLFYPLLIW